MSTKPLHVNEASPAYHAQASADDVPPGYKKTEVGVIPEDWCVIKIGAIADVGRGRVISHREIARSTSPLYPVYSSQTSNDGVMGYLDTYDFEGEYVTWTTDGANAGTVFYRNGRFNCTNVCGTIKLRRDNTFFVAKALSVVAYRYVSRNLGNPKLMNDITKQIPIALPSKLDEQRAIAEALSDVDGLIAALDKLIAKKHAIKQAAMQQLLTGKTRLPGFRGPWETKRLGEIAAIRNQKVLPSQVNPDTPCVELEHISQGDGRLLDISTARNSTSSKYRFFAGDVLFGRLRSYLRKFWRADRDGICTTEIWPLMVDPKQADSGFLYVIAQTDRFIEMASISYGTHMPRADWTVMRNFDVHLPSIDEQAAIATVLSDMDAEIAALEARRDKTRALKQGMMQQLLTGRIRLVKPTAQVESAC